jgi:hypothetical protein
MRYILLYCLTGRQNGRLAQLVERLPYKQDVISSSLVLPIIEKPSTWRLFCSKYAAPGLGVGCPGFTGKTFQNLSVGNKPGHISATLNNHNFSFASYPIPSDALSFDCAQLPLVVPLRLSKLRVASRREVSPVPFTVNIFEFGFDI